jgi:hypothetical protein
MGSARRQIEHFAAFLNANAGVIAQILQKGLFSATKLQERLVGILLLILQHLDAHR